MHLCAFWTQGARSLPAEGSSAILCSEELVVYHGNFPKFISTWSAEPDPKPLWEHEVLRGLFDHIPVECLGKRVLSVRACIVYVIYERSTVNMETQC